MTKQFQMQLGWHRTYSGKIVKSIFYIPDTITRSIHRWIIIDSNGDIYTVEDTGRYSIISCNLILDIMEYLPECTGFDWQPIVRSKTPQVGEWWRHSSGDIVKIIAMTQLGEPVIENCFARTGNFVSWETFWQHEPECTGFDWKPSNINLE